jgi:hypothetical protein
MARKKKADTSYLKDYRTPKSCYRDAPVRQLSPEERRNDRILEVRERRMIFQDEGIIPT